MSNEMTFIYFYLKDLNKDFEILGTGNSKLLILMKGQLGFMLYTDVKDGALSHDTLGERERYENR